MIVAATKWYELQHIIELNERYRNYTILSETDHHCLEDRGLTINLYLLNVWVEQSKHLGVSRTEVTPGVHFFGAAGLSDILARRLQRAARFQQGPLGQPWVQLKGRSQGRTGLIQPSQAQQRQSTAAHGRDVIWG